MVKTAGSWMSWACLGALATGAVLLQPLGCKGPEQAPIDPAVTAMLADVGPQVVVPTLNRVRDRLTALRAALVEWQAETQSATQTEVAHLLAQEAWHEVMSVWQEAEVHKLGPAASPTSAVAGQSLAERVYSWPTINPCRVDQETVYAEYEADDFADTRLVNALGLDAIEQLLFAGPDNACPGQIDINADGTWATLGADGVPKHRADYAIALVDDVIATVDALIAAWSDGSFSTTLANAGAQDSPYETQASGLNAVYDALFYVELRTKDRKVAQPMGLNNCGTDTCPDAAESLLSGGSTDWIAANLRGFRLLFVGGDGQGVHDLLRAQGHGDLADDILDALDAAETAVGAVPSPIDEAVVGATDEMQAAYEALKALTDLVKGDLATVLTMTIPNEAAGDND